MAHEPHEFDARIEEAEADTEPRVVQPPADLKAALQDSALLGTFERLSYTHQREYVEWILEAKRPDTRVRRIQRTLEQLA